MAQSPYTLKWAAPRLLNIAPLHGGIWTPSNTWFLFLGPTQGHIPNDVSIGSAILAGPMIVTDKQTMLLHL